MAASVFPVPVGALMSRWPPAASAGQASRWASVGSPRRLRNHSARRGGKVASAESDETGVSRKRNADRVIVKLYIAARFSAPLPYTYPVIVSGRGSSSPGGDRRAERRK